MGPSLTIRAHLGPFGRIQPPVGGVSPTDDLPDLKKRKMVQVHPTSISQVFILNVFMHFFAVDSMLFIICDVSSLFRINNLFGLFV